MRSHYSWETDPLLKVDARGEMSCFGSGEDARKFPPQINNSAAKAKKPEDLFGEFNVYKKIENTGDDDYDSRVKIGDSVVFSRAAYYSMAFPDMDGNEITATPNHVMYTVVGKTNPVVYGVLRVKTFGPAHEPIGARIDLPKTNHRPFGKTETFKTALTK